MLLETLLRNQQDTINCTVCGICCPSICPHKQGLKCDIHPTQREGEEERDLICQITPVELFIGGIACPPVVDRVTELTDITLQPINYFCGVPQMDRNELSRVLKKDI